MTQYVVTEPVTLHGEPAGPELDNFLLFEAGDVVEDVEFGGDDGVVDAIRVADGLDQELDFSSLVAL